MAYPSLNISLKCWKVFKLLTTINLYFTPMVDVNILMKDAKPWQQFHDDSRCQQHYCCITITPVPNTSNCSICYTQSPKAALQAKPETRLDPRRCHHTRHIYVTWHYNMTIFKQFKDVQNICSSFGILDTLYI